MAGSVKSAAGNRVDRDRRGKNWRADMQTYEDIRSEIVKFISENRIRPYDLIRVGKDLCRCGTCKFFVPHYSKDGSALDFGHCRKNKIPKSVRPYDNSCGFWALEED